MNEQSIAHSELDETSVFQNFGYVCGVRKIDLYHT